MPSFRGSSHAMDWTHISCGSSLAGRFFTSEPLGKPMLNNNLWQKRKERKRKKEIVIVMVEGLALRSSGDPPWWVQCLFTIKTGASRPLLEKNYLVPEKPLMLSWLRHLSRSLGVGSTRQRFQASLWYFLLLWPLEAAQTSCPIGCWKAEISFSWLFKTISTIISPSSHTHTHKTPLLLWRSCCVSPSSWLHSV